MARRRVTTIRKRSMALVRRDAIRVLVKELGYTDAVRFIVALRDQRGSAPGDYTKERHALLADLTVDDVIARAKTVMAEHARKKPARRRSA